MTQVQYRRRKKKKNQIPPLFWLLFVLAAAVIVIVCIVTAGTEEKAAPSQPPAEASAQPPEGNWMQLEMEPGSISQGDLVLVNAEHGIDDTAKLVSVFDQKTHSYHVKDTELSVDARIMTPLNAWMDAFQEATGLGNVNIVAGYRTKKTQQELYDSALETRGSAHAQQYIALPGRSEHHTGLAIDLDTYFPDTGASGGFDGTGEYQWVEEHAWEYGFIRRYPEFKAQFTGISYEPWHFRYVGVPHAYEMDRENLCLEEYIDLLREYPFEGEHLRVDCEGNSYEIYFCPQGKVSVPSDRPYTISGNNVDGYIVTVTGQ